jgi:hypothetical protein
MIIKPWAEFDSTLPNDQIDSEDEMDILQYPGKLLSETLAEILKGLGCEVLDLICLHERGWELIFKGGPKGRTLFLIRVTQIDKYLIGLHQARWIRTTFARWCRELPTPWRRTTGSSTCGGSPQRRSTAGSPAPFAPSRPESLAPGPRQRLT